MEIEQFLYDLSDGGDAVVGYVMTAADGSKVELCNLGAALLSYDLAGVGAVATADLVGGVPFEEQLFESRVETNRVVMSLQYEDCGVGYALEVIFDFDDEGSLEITYIGYADVGGEVGADFDITHRFKSGLKIADMSDLEAEKDAENRYKLQTAKQNILSHVLSLEGNEKCNIELLSSQPQIEISEDGFMPLTEPKRRVKPNERYIQKIVFKVTNK